jgi:hypothetical protein
MINKSTNIAEILESIDSIVSNGEYDNYSKRKIINKRKEFSKKKIDMKFNRDAEKIIIEAEKAHDDKKIGKKPLEPLILNNTKDEVASNVDRNALSLNFEKPLILLNEFKEGNIGAAEGKKLEDENNTEELDSNPAYEIKSLKNSNTQQDEKIKDLNILLNKFKSQERYSDLDKVITLYQKDNAVLRKKILRLDDVETSLRLQLSGAHYDNNTKKTPSEKIENLKKDKDANFNDIENKIQFYREENARIIIDRSEIQKKLENAKSRLLINEQNKLELKLALDKLNQILESSNIQTIF